MMMSMRMLKIRIRKFVPSIEARREGDGRDLGHVMQRRNISRNLATSLGINDISLFKEIGN